MQPLVYRIAGLEDLEAGAGLPGALLVGGEEQLVRRIDVPGVGSGHYVVSPAEPGTPVQFLAVPEGLGSAAVAPEVRWLAADAGGIGVLNTAQGPPRLQPAATLHNPDHTGAGSEPVEVDPEGFYEPWTPDTPPPAAPVTIESVRGVAYAVGGEIVRFCEHIFERQGGRVVLEPRDNRTWAGRFLFGDNLAELRQTATGFEIAIDDDRDVFNTSVAYVEALLSFFSWERVQDLQAWPGLSDVPGMVRDENGEFLLDRLNREALRRAWNQALSESLAVLEVVRAGAEITAGPAELIFTASDVADGNYMAAMLAPIPGDGFIRRLLKRHREVIARFDPAIQPVLRDILGRSGRHNRIRAAREALDAGRISPATYDQMVALRAFTQNKAYSWWMARRIQHTYGKRWPGPSYVLHHYLPLTEEFEARFIKAGLDPNEAAHTRWIPESLHRAWHSGTGQGGDFHRVWRQFFRDNPEPSRAQILEHLNTLLNNYAPPPLP